MIQAKKKTPASKKSGKKETLPDIVERILKAARRDLHVDDIVDRARRKKHKTNKQFVTSLLVKHHQRGIRFVRTGPNRYGLLK